MRLRPTGALTDEWGDANVVAAMLSVPPALILSRLQQDSNSNEPYRLLSPFSCLARRGRKHLYATRFRSTTLRRTSVFGLTTATGGWVSACARVAGLRISTCGSVVTSVLSVTTSLTGFIITGSDAAVSIATFFRATSSMREICCGWNCALAWLTPLGLLTCNLPIPVLCPLRRLRTFRMEWLT